MFCKCNHKIENHHVFEDTYYDRYYNPETDEEDYYPAPCERRVCDECDGDCYLDAMDNIQYLEWKHEEEEKAKKEIPF